MNPKRLMSKPITITLSKCKTETVLNSLEVARYKQLKSPHDSVYFVAEICRSEGSWLTRLNYCKKEKPANKECYTYQICPSKIKKLIKTFSDKEKLRSLQPLDLTYEKH